jgi:putative ABC transport system permease protein
VLHLIRILALGQMLRSPARALMTLAGVALGVGLVFANDVVSTSVNASFRRSVEVLAGRASWVLGETGGVDESVIDEVRAVDGVEAAWPLIRELAREARTSTSLSIVALDLLNDERVQIKEQVGDGLDFLNDPLAVLVTPELARRMNLAPGSELPLDTSAGRKTFHVHSIAPESNLARAFGGDLLLMDVYAAQLSFDRGRRFDRIDVVPSAGTNVSALGGRLRAVVAERATLSRPQEHSEETDKLLAGFQLGVWLASLVAMVGSAFIIYNTLAVAVVQRRREIGVMRALGATRPQILALIVGEGAVLGVLGALVGLVLGLVGGQFVLDLASAAVGELATSHVHAELEISGGQLLVALAIGVLTSVFATALPALRASRVEPAVALQQQLGSEDVGIPSSIASPVCLLAMVLALIAALLAHRLESFAVGACATVLLAVAGALAAPAVVRGVAMLATRCMSSASPPVRLGVASFRDSQARNAVAAAALGLALGNVVNVGYFLGSIKNSTQEWFERVVRADLLVFGGQSVSATFEHPFPGELAAGVLALPGVEYVNAVRASKQRYRGETFLLAAHDIARSSKYDEIPVVQGELASALEAITAGKAVAASETFVRTFNVKLGDRIALQTPSGPASFELALIYVDYGSNLGILAIDRNAYLALWKDTRVDNLWIYAAPGSDVVALRKRVTSALGTEQPLMVLANAAFKEGVMEIFDRSFLLTHALEAIAILVALFGVANTLAVSVVDRARELGILRALGATRTQLNTVFLIEAALVGASASVLGVLGGALSSLYMVKELLRLEMGWRIDWHASPWTTLMVVVVAQLVALIACWFPIRAAARMEVAAVLSYD